MVRRLMGVVVHESVTTQVYLLHSNTRLFTDIKSIWNCKADSLWDYFGEHSVFKSKYGYGTTQILSNSGALLPFKRLFSTRERPGSISTPKKHVVVFDICWTSLKTWDALRNCQFVKWRVDSFLPDCEDIWVVKTGHESWSLSWWWW